MTAIPIPLRHKEQIESKPQAPALEEMLVPPLPAVEEVWDKALQRTRFEPVESALPAELELGFLLDRRLRVLAPIPVRLSAEDDRVVAHVEELNEYGYGDNSSEAIADLQRVLAELFYTLRDAQQPLGADLQRTWDRLCQLIEPRS